MTDDEFLRQHGGLARIPLTDAEFNRAREIEARARTAVHNPPIGASYRAGAVARGFLRRSEGIVCRGERERRVRAAEAAARGGDPEAGVTEEWD